MAYYKKLAGQHIYLVPFDPENAETCARWAEWMNDRAVSAYYGGEANLVSLSAARKTLETLSGYRFGIVHSSEERLIGHISLHDIDWVSRNAFLGIFIGEASCRNRGYGGEAIRLVLSYAFRTLNLHAVMLTVHADNATAIASCQKAGFQIVGQVRDWIFKNGAYVDKFYMEILNRDFDMQKTP